MNHQNHTSRRGATLLFSLGLGALLLSTARAGDIYLTGHDVLLHGGQNGYDAIIMDYLRGADAKATYNIGIVGTVGSGSASFTGGSNFTGGAAYHSVALSGTLSGYQAATFYDAQTLSTDANRASIINGFDLLIVESYTNCGGCSLTAAGSTALNTMSGLIATAFNNGMDIWGQAGQALSTYYNFLPPGVVASGTSIGDSSGFVATTDGLGLGILPTNINGFQTHNNFSTYSPSFTVFETRPTSGNEAISIGLRSGTIDTGTGTISVPDSTMTALLLGLALPVMAFVRRSIGRKSV